MIEIKSNKFDIEARRQKILDGTYPERVVQGRQNKHIEGTREFEQNSEKMNRLSPGSKPSVLTADAKTLIEKYKGTGDVRPGRGSPYPRETIDTDKIIGKAWVISKQKYVNTKRFVIIYSSNGVHIVPISDYMKGV